MQFVFIISVSKWFNYSYLPQGPASAWVSRLVNLLIALLIVSSLSQGSMSFLRDSLQMITKKAKYKRNVQKRFCYIRKDWYNYK